MAIGEITTVAAGVTRFEFVIGFHHWGTRDALIRARLARPEWFASGKRDRRGRKVLSVKAVHEGRPIRCIEQGKGRYQVTTYYTGAERGRRMARQWGVAA